MQCGAYVGKKARLLIGLSSLQEPFGEIADSSRGEIELERVEDVALHLEDLLPSVRIVRYVDKIFDQRRVDLFVFAGRR